MDSVWSPSPGYRHTQRSGRTLLGLGVAIVTQLGGLVRAVRNRKRHAWPRSLAMVLLTSLMYVFSALTVEIAHGVLTVEFRAGVLQRTIALAAIREVEQVEVRWYYGWGWRWTPRGWLYNVQGRDAVALGLSNGRTVIIGTDEPAELVRRIQAARRELGVDVA